MRNRHILLIALLLVAGLPRPSLASGFINVGLGLSFSPSAQVRPNLVADVGWLPREPIGVELDVAYAPKFFKDLDGLTKNRLTSVMANVIVAGGDRSSRFGRRRRGLEFRPFVSGGFGVISETVATAAAFTDISNSHLGVNAGVGVMALSRRSLGLRAEIRYFQDLIGSSGANTTGIDFGSLHFWRASVGLVAAF